MSAHADGAIERLVARRPHPGRRGLLTLLLVAATAAAADAIDLSRGLLNPGAASVVAEIGRAVVAPDLSPSFLATVGSAALLTIAYAVAAMTVSLAIGLPAAVLASGVLVRWRTPRLASVALVRTALAGLRAIDELVWALLLVTVFGLSPLAGVLGIGIPYGATIARVLAERLQDVPEAPLRALRAAGASETQVLLYGRLPSALSDIVSYLLYRFECAVRAAAILSFAGLGGLGLQLTIALDDLRFERVTTLLAVLTLLVVAVDLLGARLRDRIVA